MKTLTTICFIGIALFAAGCANERIPAEEADAWEIPAESNATPANNTSTPAAATPAQPASAPEALPADVVAELKGSDFKLDGTTRTLEYQGDSLVVGHYFAASAPVELKTSVTLIETDIDGRNINKSVPLIGLQLASTSGKYRNFGKDARPVDGKQTLRDRYDIGPGSYNMTISYYKDTVGMERPPVSLNRILFKNVEVSDETTSTPVAQQ